MIDFINKIRILKKGQITKENTQSKDIFYLKFNRSENWAFHSLQEWIDVINDIGGDFYIVCDKPKLKKEIYKKITFHNENIKIIESQSRSLLNLSKKLVHPKWIRAAAAHIITFIHAKKNNIKTFWNIDADDTMFCLPHYKVAQILIKAKEYAENHKIDLLSLDMWRSRSYGIHWSFGVTYTRLTRDYKTLFKEFTNIDWQKDYAFYNVPLNVDWLFNYFTQYRELKTASFYVNNCQFIHWGDFLVNVIGGSLTQWKDGELIHPLLLYGFDDVINGKIPISKDCICLDVDVNVNESKEYMKTHFFNYDTSIKK